MNPIKISFKDCDREYLEDTFSLVQVMKHDLLSEWIKKGQLFQITAMENEILTLYQENLK